MWTFFYVSDSVLLTARFLCDVSTSLFVALPHFVYIVASLQRLSDSCFAHLYIHYNQRLIKFAVFSFQFLMEGMEPSDCGVERWQHIPAWLLSAPVTVVPILCFDRESSIAHCLVWRGKGETRLKECPLPFVHLSSLASALDLCLVFLPTFTCFLLQ